MSIEALSWAWEQKLKPGPKLVLLALADHADHEGVCWPGFDGLAAKTGMSRSTVIENVKQLVALELVTVEKRADSHGHRASNRYILHISKVRKSNVGNPNVGKPNVGNPDSGGNPHQQRAEAEDRHSKVRKSNVGFSDAKVRNPDPNRQLEPSTSSPIGDSVVGAEPLILVPLNDGTEHPVTDADVTEWQALYPAVDVPQELRKMRGWCLANPKRRKTRRGVGAFINAWLAKEQDRGGSSAPAGGYPHAARQPVDNSAIARVRRANGIPDPGGRIIEGEFRRT